MANAPPPYTEYTAEQEPSPPRTFPIGTQTTAALVDVAELKAHLKLLGAFDKLRERVESQPGLAREDKNGAWALFLARAVYRFERWAEGMMLKPSEHQERTCPPLDVAMVWHTYCLNPRTYYEDGKRRPSNGLGRLGSFPLTLTTSLISQDLIPLPASEDRAAVFEEATGEPFEAPFVTDPKDTCTIRCPLCHDSEPITMHWIKDELAGYGQRKFQGLAPSRTMDIRKFCDEVFERKDNTDSVFLSGTLLDPVTGQANPIQGKTFNDAILQEFDVTLLKPGATPQLFGTQLKWSVKQLEKYVRGSLTSFQASRSITTFGPRRLTRIFSAYRHPGLASIDISSAVLRQGSFIRKMVQLGWTSPDRFDSEAGVTLLNRSIARSHAFLDLITANPSAMFVPTVDIDLAWHTHQLNATSYWHDTYLYLNRTPDHDDAIEGSTLSYSYDTTARAWKARFGAPYSMCGCAPEPVPTTSSIGGKLSSKIFKSETAKVDKSAAQQPLQNERPDLVSMEEDVDATHPSEHNSVTVIGYKYGEVRKKARTEDIQRRVKDASKQRQKNKEKQRPETWSDIQIRNRETVRHHHAEAFSATYTYPGLHPFGVYGSHGSCAAFSGGPVDPGEGDGDASAFGGSSAGCAIGQSSPYHPGAVGMAAMGVSGCAAM